MDELMSNPLGLPLELPLGMIGLTELWPIAIVVLLLFGARKLPELAHAMGSSINQFKKGLDTGADDEDPKKVEGGPGKGDA